MNAKQTKAARTAHNNAVKAALATASTIGFDIAGGFARAVQLITLIKGSPKQMEKAQADYVSGYVARSLQRIHAERLGNADMKALLREADKVIGKASPDNTKKGADEKRSVDEHKACRAAATSWATAKKQAGVEPTKAGGRAPRPASNEPAAATDTAQVPNDAPKLTLAAPKLANDNADAYFASAIAALLATCDVNADAVSKPWSDFISDTYQRAVKAKLIPSAE